MSNVIDQQEIRPAAKSSTISNSPVGKIIVVDDEPELKNILVESLSAQGFEVTGCSSGYQALEELRQKEFDLLLTDLMMPEMDGIELLEAALKVDPQLLGIVMTGQGSIQTAVDAMKLGAFDYVLKPFRLQTLMPVLTRAINTRRLRMENLQLRETVAIYSLCQTIAFTLDPQTVLSKLADAALQQSDADEVSVLLPTTDGTELYVAAVRGHKRERLLGERIPLQQSISSWVARERIPLILNGEVHDDRFVALWPRSEIRSAVSVPMQVANKLVGIINLNVTNRLRPFTLGQMKALTILASTAAAALESASLYAQVQQAEKNYRSIFENAVEGIFQSTAAGRFIKMNPAMAQILGYASAEEAIERITDIAQQVYVDPLARSKLDRLQKDNGGILQSCEFEASRKNGERIWLSLNRRTIRDHDGIELYHEGSVEDITKRKRVEEAVRLSQQQYESLVQSIDGIVWELDVAAFRFTFVSQQAERLLGYPPERWINEADFWLEHLHPDDRPWVLNFCVTATTAKEDHQFDYRMIAADGRTIWLRDLVTVECSDGVPVRLRGVMVDITERKQAEEALRQSETQLAEAQRLAHIGSWNWDLAKNVLTWSDEHYRIFGIKRGDIEVNNRDEVFNFIHPEDREMVKSMVSGTIETKEPFDYYFRVIRPDGPERILHSTGSIETDDQGEPTRMFGTAQDVTERKRIEQELEQSEGRYRGLVENAHDLIYEHDMQGNYTSANKAGELITGYTTEESLKLNLKDTVAPEFLDKAHEMLKQKIAGETVTAYELELVAKDGHHVSVEVNTRLVYHKGKPVGVQGIARDVTERKLLEAQLRQSQKLEAIGQLAGGIAHDFNNLLTVIGGYSSILLGKLPKGNPHRSSIEEIKKASDRASVLTRQLLAFSRKQILQPKILDLNVVVADMEKMARRLIGEDIDLLTITSPVLGKVKADPGQIEQVLLNLIVNARDAMPKGGKLTIETRNVVHSSEYGLRHAAQAGPYVMLVVSDTGCGMDAAIQPRVFEPFFTTKGSGKGTGLGLATVYGIVKQSGGNIWVYSEVGRGSTFKISLPRVDEVSEVEDEVIPGAIPKGTELVLLVEDEEQVRTILQEILDGLGYSVLAASNGQEALLISENLEHDIKLMITDVVMPHMSGRELAERVQLLRPTLPVLFMSGYTDDAIVRHGLLDEKLHFIQKPFDSATVARKVREVLDSPAS